MDARLQRRIQRYGWDKAAPFYERYWQAQLAPARARLFELAELRSGQRVLDVACGTGLVTFPAARAVGRSGAVVATDISDAMVGHVRAEAAALDLAQVSASRTDAENLQFPDRSFDVVLCALGLMYVPDVQVALREMRRVLCPGGLAVAAVWGARNRCGWAEIFPIVDARVQSEVCPMFFQLGTGVVEVRADRIATELRYDSAEAATGAAFAGGPVALAYSRFDDETRRNAESEYLASIAAYRTAQGYAIPGEFVVARARRPLE
jgi:ubiquinone/menaquinone biosynthesis C-methylase UbiE